MQKGFFASLLLMGSALAELASAASELFRRLLAIQCQPQNGCSYSGRGPIAPLNICAPQMGSAGLPVPDPACTPAPQTRPSLSMC